MIFEEPYVTPDKWLDGMNTHFQELRQLFVLRQFHTAGYQAYTRLHEYICLESRLPYYSSDDETTFPRVDPTPEHGKPIPFNYMQLFPYKKLEQRSTILTISHHPVPDNHPVINYIALIVHCIYNLGYIPTTANAPSHHSVQRDALQPKGIQVIDYPASIRLAKICYEISSFILSIFGTWYNVYPCIVMLCLNTFLPIAPLYSLMISSHLIQRSPNMSPVLKSIFYRRDLYMIALQSLITSLRTRFHVIYHPTLYATTSEYGKDSPYHLVFLDADPTHLEITSEQLKFYANEVKGLQSARSKQRHSAYIPHILVEQLLSLLDSTDFASDPLQYIPYDDFPLIILDIDNVTKLLPSLSGTFRLNPSIVFRPKPPISISLGRVLPPKEEDEQLDEDEDDDDDRDHDHDNESRHGLLDDSDHDIDSDTPAISSSLLRTLQDEERGVRQSITESPTIQALKAAHMTPRTHTTSMINPSTNPVYFISKNLPRYAQALLRTIAANPLPVVAFIIAFLAKNRIAQILQWIGRISGVNFLLQQFLQVLSTPFNRI